MFTSDEIYEAALLLGMDIVDIQKVIYGDENREMYMNAEGYSAIGYSGSKMLVVNFKLDFSENKIVIVEANYPTLYEINENFCKRRCL